MAAWRAADFHVNARCNLKVGFGQRPNSLLCGSAEEDAGVSQSGEDSPRQLDFDIDRRGVRSSSLTQAGQLAFDKALLAPLGGIFPGAETSEVTFVR